MAVNANGLTDAQMKKLRETLEKKLNDLNSEVRDLEAALTNDDNDSQGAPDEVDRSSYEEEMQRQQLVLDGKAQLRYEVTQAIKRMDDGSYGICEETEEPIGAKRLTAQPWTRYSLEAQQDLERRRKSTANMVGGGMMGMSAYPSAYESEGTSTGGGGGGGEEE